MFLPIPTKVLGVDAVKFGCRPRFGMDAVRNAGDGYFLKWGLPPRRLAIGLDSPRREACSHR